MIKRSIAKWFLLKTAITATAIPASTAFVTRGASSAATARASAAVATRSGQLPTTLPPTPTPMSLYRRHISDNGKSKSNINQNQNKQKATPSINSIPDRGTTSLFESMRTGYYRKTNSDEISLEKLLEKAASVRSKTPPAHFDIENLNDPDRLSFWSSYDASNSGGGDGSRSTSRRGFSNWIVPGTIMVGQYPGRVPETTTPTEEEVKAHLRNVLFETTIPIEGDNLVQAKDVCFVSLQSELPPQNDYDSWNKSHGEIYLDLESRSEWPNPFSHYKPTVESVLEDYNVNESNASVSVRYLHHPIQDLSVPSNSKKMKLLLWKILDVLDHGAERESMVYIHCWGGRGRAGLTACCLLTLLEFAAVATTDSNGDSERKRETKFEVHGVQSVFDVVQTGYESRVGSENMPPALSRSPQTESQRDFVKRFYEEVRAEAEAIANEKTNRRM